VIRCLFG